MALMLQERYPSVSGFTSIADNCFQVHSLFPYKPPRQDLGDYVQQLCFERSVNPWTGPAQSGLITGFQSWHVSPALLVSPLISYHPAYHHGLQCVCR